MNNFDKFCNQILEAYGKRIDIPYDGRTAPDRFNNPGGAYPKKGLEKYGMEGYGLIGGGHPIAKYPTLANGIAANIAHLKSMPIVGKTVGEARHYWVNGNFQGSKSLSGMDNNQVITQELLNDPNWLAQWIKATAKDEGFSKSGRQIDDNSLNQAFAILQNKSNFEPSQAYASSNETPSSSSTTKTGENKEEDSFTSGLSQKISDIYNKAGGITAASAKAALATAVNTGLGLINKYSNNKSVSDTDAFLGKGAWKTTDDEEKENKKFLGKV